MLLAQQVRDIARRHPALTHWRSRAGLALIADRGDPIALDQHPGGAGGAGGTDPGNPAG